MKVTLFVRESRAKSSKGSAQLPLIVRFRNGKMHLWQTTRLSVNPEWWDEDHQQLKARMAFNSNQRQEFDNEVAAIRKYVSDAFYACKDPSAISHDWLERVVRKYYKDKDTLVQVRNAIGEKNLSRAALPIVSDTKILIFLETGLFSFHIQLSFQPK